MIFLLEQAPTVPQDFWYWIAGIAFAGLVYFELMYRKDIKDILKGTRETLNILKANDQEKERRLNDHDDDIKAIRDRVFVVDYPKNKRHG